MTEFLMILIMVLGTEVTLLMLKYEVDHHEVNYTKDVFVPKELRDY